jgi:hypothetical protein
VGTDNRIFSPQAFVDSKKKEIEDRDVKIEDLMVKLTRAKDIVTADGKVFRKLFSHRA